MDNVKNKLRNEEKEFREDESYTQKEDTERSGIIQLRNTPRKRKQPIRRWLNTK